MRIIVFALLNLLAISGDAVAQERYANLSKQERLTAFTKAMKLIMGLATPSVPESVRDTLVAEYEMAQGYKAQAVELTTKRYWRSAFRESPARAADAALEGCQFRFEAPCAIIAIDHEITGGTRLVPKAMPRLDYKGKFDPAMIPAVRDATLRRPDIEAYKTAPQHKAIAFHPSGRVFSSSSKANIHDAIWEALRTCNSEKTIDIVRDGPCFIYAINDDVVLTERLTK